MEYRPLGLTGLQVSALGYGASSLGGVFGSIDEAAGIASVRAALDLGINLIDVSPYYGLTVAENVLGNRQTVIRGNVYEVDAEVEGRADRCDAGRLIDRPEHPA